MRGLVIANLKEFGTYSNDNDELIVFGKGYFFSGSTSFRSLNGTGSNLQVVGLDDLTSLYNSS